MMVVSMYMDGFMGAYQNLHIECLHYATSFAGKQKSVQMPGSALFCYRK